MNSPLDYSLKDAPLYPPGLGNFFKNLGADHSFAIHGKEVLLAILFFFLLFYTVVSIVLFYHWMMYGMRNKYIIFAEISFAGVSLFLFWTAYIIITLL